MRPQPLTLFLGTKIGRHGCQPEADQGRQEAAAGKAARQEEPPQPPRRRSAPLGCPPRWGTICTGPASTPAPRRPQPPAAAYRTDFAIFETWCAERGAVALPASPETVAAFLAAEASRRVRPSTIGRRVAAIRYAHKLAGHGVLPTDDERVRATVRGIRRSLGTAPRKKTPATAERIVAMAPIAGQRLGELRDRALLLLGFAGAFRRSELVALDIEDIEEAPEGLRITIRRGKTDQEGKGVVIAIVRGSIACPVAAFKAWIAAAAITTGPVFRPIAKGERIQAARLTDRSVAKIVKAHAERAGLDPTSFSGHSLAVRLPHVSR